MDDSTGDEVLLRFDDPDANRAVVLEDDGRVAYAYLVEDDEIVGDVWLYNVAETPELPGWQDPSQMPFLNPRGYCKAQTLPRLTPDTELDCRWYPEGVELSFQGLVIARLESGAKPGWSLLAARSGPLANPLEPNT